MIIIISNVDFQKEMVDKHNEINKGYENKERSPGNCRTVEEDNSLWFQCLIPNITIITNLYT